MKCVAYPDASLSRMNFVHVTEKRKPYILYYDEKKYRHEWEKLSHKKIERVYIWFWDHINVLFVLEYTKKGKLDTKKEFDKTRWRKIDDLWLQ